MRWARWTWQAWALLGVLCLVAGPAVAAPVTLSLQGTLRTPSGGPVADGDYLLKVALYDAEKAVAPTFQEKHAVKVKGGLFALQVGADDPTKPLDDALLIAQKARFLGISVGTDPELARVAMRPVASAVTARSAAALHCTGCVGTAHVAVGAIESKHVKFVWAAGATKGGSAKHALAADAAKKADEAQKADEAKKAAEAVKAQFATAADSAKFADAAGNAKTAESAKVAAEASALKCTGCVTADHLAKTVPSDLAKKGLLSAVALSGKFADVSGPLAADLDFNKQQAKLFRFQNADKDPAPCTKDTIGLAYYDTKTQTLKVCNGTQFHVFAKAAPLGSPGQPATSCKAILAEDASSSSGLYHVTIAGKAQQVYCEMKTQGGGWMLAGVVSSSDNHNWTHALGTWENDVTFGTPDPGKDADYKGPGFAHFGASEVRIDFQGNFLLRTGACLGGKSLAGRFSGLSWTCGGSANLSSQPACSHHCAIVAGAPTNSDPVLSEGKNLTHLYFKAGEADGAQDTNKDRAFLSTNARNHVDEPFGLGSFCSGSSCAIKGDVDMGVRNDGAKFPGKGLRYAIFVR